ncbi:MAG: InlB B-repeat-containing protein, partial [Defluviitaleaceae bacterium]|nr:InlB B-repeat-containing protein [Defluviitaleaceae bacterium]
DVDLEARWEPLRVYFDPMDGTLPPGFQMREFLWGGEIGAANIPPPPNMVLPDGRTFMAWVRPPSLYGSAGTTGLRPGLWYDTLFHGSSWIHAIESPLTVHARYGWTITFHCSIHVLPPGYTNITFSPRLVYSDNRTITTSNIENWTTNVIWPNPHTLTNTLSFLGWYTKNGGVYDQRIDENTLITSNLDVHARWAPRHIIFNPQDGVTLPGDFETRELTAAANATIVGGAASIPVPSPHPGGLHFITWTRTPAGLLTATAAASAERVTLWSQFWAVDGQAYAFGQWGHRVTFNGNGVTLSNNAANFGAAATSYDPRIVLPGMTFAEANLNRTWQNNVWPNDPNIVGRFFLGWYTCPAFNTRFEFDADYVFNQDYDLYARWQVSYVYFDPQDGTPSNLFEYRILGPGGNVGTAYMPDNPTKDGYRFIAWTRTPDGTAIPPWSGTTAAIGVNFNGSSTVAVEHVPLTVYAQWGHQISFNANPPGVTNGIAGSMTTPRIVRTGFSNAQHEICAWVTDHWWPNNPTRVNYHFAGWYTMNSNGEFVNRVNTHTIITPSLVNEGSVLGDITLFARWVPVDLLNPMTVNFYLNNGLGYAATNVPTNAVGAVPQLNWPANPTWDDNVFLIWSRTQDGSGTTQNVSQGIRFVHFINNTNASTITYYESPFTAYAQWGHLVTFYGNGMTLPNQGSLAVNGYAARTISTGRNVAEHNALIWTAANVFPLTVTWPNDPVRGGWVFAGWHTRVGGQYDKLVDATTQITASYRLYARWERMEVIFNMNDSTGDYERVYVESNTAVGVGGMPERPDRPGYGFINWTRTQSGEVYGHLPWVNSTATNNGLLFAHNSTLPPGTELPFHVYAQWSRHVTFFGNGIDLPAGLGAGGYSARNISIGRNIAEHNALAWTTNLTWPINPATRICPEDNLTVLSFIGWSIRDASGTNIEGWFDQHSQMPEYRNLTLWAEWQAETPLTV